MQCFSALPAMVPYPSSCQCAEGAGSDVMILILPKSSENSELGSCRSLKPAPLYWDPVASSET